MTSRVAPPQCASCQHWRSPLDSGLVEQTCTAFPGDIPDEIWWNQFDHRKPYEGDHGIRWESLDGAIHPNANP